MLVIAPSTGNVYAFHRIFGLSSYFHLPFQRARLPVTDEVLGFGFGFGLRVRVKGLGFGFMV